MGHKISKEQIDPGVKDYIMSFVGDINDLETDDKSNIINAVNSLMVDRVDNAENIGKLADAIGEPVTANHSVDEVVEGLGELLSTFKTNMMNSGVVVESSDKFKALIDKIEGLIEGEGNKGIKFASGTVACDDITQDYFYKINNIGFKPTILLMSTSDITSTSSTPYYKGIFYNGLESETEYVCYINDYSSTENRSIQSIEFITDVTFINEDSVTLRYYVNGYEATDDFKWYAIGVGEEDTTLRDSLASILEEEGVSVTEEDDMASLISKVDEEFDRQVVPAGDAVAEDVLSGKTFMNSTGELLTGLLKLGDDVYASDEELIVLLNGSTSVSSKSTIIISSAILPFTGTIRMQAEVSVDNVGSFTTFGTNVVFNLYRDGIVTETYSYKPESSSYTDMTYDFNVQFGDIIKIEVISDSSIWASYNILIQNIIIKGTIGIKPPEEDGGDSGEVEDDETITNPIVAGKSKELFEEWVYTESDDGYGSTESYTYTVDTIDGYTEGEVYFDICPCPEYYSNVDEIEVTGYMYLNGELKCSKSLVSEGTWYAEHFYYGPFSIKQGDVIKCEAIETSSDGDNHNSSVIFGVCYDNLNETE